MLWEFHEHGIKETCVQIPAGLISSWVIWGKLFHISKTQFFIYETKVMITNSLDCWED